MITWIKPSGQELETNDRKETVEYLESLGYERKPEKKTRKPRAKQQNDVENPED